jgi:glycosyltransferase involved in cell wall biosynthesis
MPRISVIMPAYNASKYISEAIESILNQTFTDFELFICDDGSTDGTLDIIQKYAQSDGRIRVLINNKNIGNLKTTNRLLAECKGEYIAIQDADDVSSINRLELLKSEFDTNPDLGIVGSNYIVTDENLNAMYCGYFLKSNEEIKSIMQREPPPLLYASVLVKKNIIEKAGIFRPVFKRRGYADLDWIYRICEITQVKNINNIAYYYRQHKKNSDKKKDFFELNGIEIIVESHNQRLRGDVDFLEAPSQLRIRMFLSQLYIKRAEKLVWDNQPKEAQRFFFNSFVLYPFNVYVIKSLIKIIFQQVQRR